jgi:hypothetical protein
MRKIPRAIKTMLMIGVIGAMVVIGAVMAAMSAGPASALQAGYGQSEGLDRGGYEYSAASGGHVPSGGLDRGGYEYS